MFNSLLNYLIINNGVNRYAVVSKLSAITKTIKNVLVGYYHSIFTLIH